MIIETIIFILPVLAVFGTLGWIQLFFTTYTHHEKMKNPQRFIVSATSATILVLILLAIVTAFLYFFFSGVFK